VVEMQLQVEALKATVWLQVVVYISLNKNFTFARNKSKR
jgi:hypothetical protein